MHSLTGVRAGKGLGSLTRGRLHGGRGTHLEQAVDATHAEADLSLEHSGEILEALDLLYEGFHTSRLPQERVELVPLALICRLRQSTGKPRPSLPFDNSSRAPYGHQADGLFLLHPTTTLLLRTARRPIKSRQSAVMRWWDYPSQGYAHPTSTGIEKGAHRHRESRPAASPGSRWQLRPLSGRR